MSKDKPPSFDPEYIRDLSEKVYRIRIEQDSAGAVDRMLAKDDDGGKKLRNRSGAYDPLTRAYLAALDIKPLPPSE